MIAAASVAYSAAAAASEPTQIDTPVQLVAESSATPSPVRNDNFVIAAKSLVSIEITQDISSKINKLGDSFSLKLVEPLVLRDRTILPAGTRGAGEITHAAKSGWGGKAGELIVNARYLECGGVRIPLGHLRYSVAGKGNFAGAFAASQVIPMGQFLVSGHDALIPAGVKATAQVTVDTTISAQSVAQCTPATQ